MSWATSSRRGRLPPDWPKRVAATKARAAGMCEAPQHDPRCNGIGTDCDHEQRGDNHSLDNLRWLNHWCHKAKTAREAADGRATARAARKRTEPHPGLL